MIRTLNLNLNGGDEEKILSLNELEEREAYDNTWLSKERAKILHDRQINRKVFFPSRKVLLYDSRLHLFSGKLRSTRIGPHIVVQVSLMG